MMATTATNNARQDEKQDRNIHSAKEQQEQLWEHLVQHSKEVGDNSISWPSYDDVVKEVATSDYQETLTCPFDTRTSSQNNKSKPRSLCAHGVVCCVKLELFPVSSSSQTKKYSGLLTPGTTVEHCLLRLSSALKPSVSKNVETRWEKLMSLAVSKNLRESKIIPCVALKAFRNGGIQSGNLLFAGRKVGQTETNFFAHCKCTHLTEKVPSLFLPFVRRFWSYSDYPLSLGVSDFTSHDAQGVPASNSHDENNFPFAITLQPRLLDANSNNDATDSDPFDVFLNQVLSIPVGTTLYDIFASPDPMSVDDPTKLQRIGRIVTTSQVIRSSGSEHGLFFRHQKKEDDYELRPHWRSALDRTISMDNGQTTGSVRKLVGWKLFEQHIQTGSFVNFETKDSGGL